VLWTAGRRHLTVKNGCIGVGAQKSRSRPECVKESAGYGVMWGLKAGNGGQAGEARARGLGRVRNTPSRPECPKK
jgi:hypothetical protein